MLCCGTARRRWNQFLKRERERHSPSSISGLIKCLWWRPALSNMVVHCPTSGSCVAMDTQITQWRLLRKWPKSQCQHTVKVSKTWTFHDHVRMALFSFLKPKSWEVAILTTKNKKYLAAVAPFHSIIFKICVYRRRKYGNCFLLACLGVADGLHHPGGRCWMHFEINSTFPNESVDLATVPTLDTKTIRENMPNKNASVLYLECT